MPRLRLTLLALILLMLSIGSVRGQTTTPPLLMLVNGADVWAYDETIGIRQITFSGFVDRPALSPDGTRIAYRDVAEIGVQALQVTGGLASELPSDIVLQDLVTSVVTPLASQPPDATFNAGEPARAIVRSSPAWSPDSTMLAWTEDLTPEDTRQLVTYNLGTGEARILTANLPLQAGFQQTLPVRWGAGGIALQSITASPGGAPEDTQTGILIYNPDDGTLLSSTFVQPAPAEYIDDFNWIDDHGVPKVGVIYSTGRWDLIDPTTGTIAPASGTPQLYSLLAPDGLAIDFGVTSLPGTGSVFTWTVGTTPLPYTGPIEWISVSGAGNAVVYAQQGDAYIWRDGQIEIVPGVSFNMMVGDVIWSAVGWRIRP